MDTLGILCLTIPFPGREEVSLFPVYWKIKSRAVLTSHFNLSLLFITIRDYGWTWNLNITRFPVNLSLEMRDQTSPGDWIYKTDVLALWVATFSFKEKKKSICKYFSRNASGKENKQKRDGKVTGSSCW